MAYEEIVKGTTVNNGAATRFVNKIALGVADLNLLLLGDSVSDNVGEWFYLVAQYLGTTYPTHTISYRAWDTTNEVYATASILSTGTGSRTINVWNCAVASSTGYYPLAQRFQTAVVNTSADVVMIAYGHNHTDTVPDESLGVFLNVTQSVSDALPDAQIIMSALNPRTDGLNGRITQAYDHSRRMAARFGYVFVDPYRAFIDYPSYATALIDGTGIHPNSTGHTVWRDVAKQPFKPRRQSAPDSQSISTFQTSDENLLRNARFQKWSAGTTSAPDFWGLFGTGSAISQGTTTEVSLTPARLTTGAVTNQAWLRQQLDARDQPKVKGRQVTLCARVFIPTANTADITCNAMISHTSNASTFKSFTLPVQAPLPGPVKGAYHWLVATTFLATSVPNDVTAGVFTTTGTTGTVDVTIDRIWFGVGGVPREWSESLLDAQYTLSTRVRTETTGTVALTASDATVQRFQTTLTGNVTVTLPTTNISTGHTFRIIRSAAGAFTLTVSTIAAPANKVFASATQGWVEVMYNGTSWEQIAADTWP